VCAKHRGGGERLILPLDPAARDAVELRQARGHPGFPFSEFTFGFFVGVDRQSTYPLSPIAPSGNAGPFFKFVFHEKPGPNTGTEAGSDVSLRLTPSRTQGCCMMHPNCPIRALICRLTHITLPMKKRSMHHDSSVKYSTVQDSREEYRTAHLWDVMDQSPHRRDE
jgi:hypothetical protein